MIEKLIDMSIRQRVFVAILVVALIGVGLRAANLLPIDAVPDITNVQVQINTSVPSLAPEEIEKLVTYPIEVEMGGIEHLQEIRSISKFGLSQVSLIFDEEADLYRARQLVSERLQNVSGELPPGVTPQMGPITTGLGEIYFYTLRYKDGAPNKPTDPVEEQRQLRLVQDYIVKPALRAVPGVTEVNTSGGYNREVLIEPNPEKMRNAGLTMSDLVNVIETNTQNAGGSIVEQASEAITIRVASRVTSAEDIANLPIKFRAGTQALKVGDVANVVVGSSVRVGTATVNGQEAVIGVTMMLLGQNSRIVSQEVDKKIKSLQSKLPEGVEISTLYDRTDLINKTIETVIRNLAEGAVLVVVILIALLGNWRAAFIVALMIPLSMLFAVTGMVQWGISGNLMSLGAIDFGLIIDGAIVIAENIIRQLAEKQHSLKRNLSPHERIHTIFAATKEVATPTVFGVIIITLVYVPILSLTGVEGKMFKPMALTVILALVGALILSLTAVPALCTFFMTKPVKEKDNFLITWSKRLYQPVLEFTFQRRWWVVACSVAVFGLSLWVFSRLGSEFVPQLDEGSIAMQMVRANSVGLNATINIEKQVEQALLKEFPEIRQIIARIGTAEVATDPMGVNVSDCYIMLTPEDQWSRKEGHPTTKEELVAQISKFLNEKFPEQSYLFSQPIQLRFNELLSGTRADLSIKVFGDDYDKLEKLADQVKQLVEKIPGAADVEYDAVGKAPIYTVSMNRAAMGQYNVIADEVNKTVATALAGSEAGIIVDGNKRYPVVVRMNDKDRVKIDQLSQLPIRTQDGNLVRLGQVTEGQLVDAVNTISRDASQRRMAIMVNLRGRDVASFVKEAQEQIREKIKMPDGYFTEFGGQFENLERARARLAIVVPATLAMIFVFIFMAFRSLRQTLLIYTGIPFAISGGIFALWLRDLPFSISAGVGFIALSGVAVLNGVVMISFFNQLREAGRRLHDAVREGALVRMRSVLITALAPTLGFVPMAIGHGAGAEVQRPLATVVIGGIVSATFLTLLLLPTLYYKLEERADAERARKYGFPSEGDEPKELETTETT